MNISQQIRQRRKELQITQKQLASYLNTRQSAISRAEKLSYKEHSISFLTDVANALNCDIEINLKSRYGT